MYYAGYSGREKWNIALFIIAGAIAGLLYGLLEYVANIVPNMQFHSAGVITQSAIYLGMVIILNVGMLLSAKAQDKDIKIYLWIALIIESIALVYMGSRGGLLAVFMVLVVILLVNIRIKYVAIFALATGVIVIASSALLWVFPQNSMTSGGFKQYSVERFAMADSERMENWKIAAEKIRSGQDLVLGIGPRNYKIIDPAEFGISSAYYKRSGELHHAHNLFLTRIIEQGLAGLTALLLFYILILMMLINSIRMNKGGKLEWYFYAGLAGLTIPVIAGMFNAPFYQEHAMLSMILMGIYASSPDSKVSG
jgi:O-antigen ligase